MRNADLGEWEKLLPYETRELADELACRAKAERGEGKEIFPPQDSIFKALQLTPPGAVRAVIVGQDPYHTPGAANGLAFSVSAGVAIPPSLRNIFRELQSDLEVECPESGDLTPWAKHGVLLLNTLLTVEQGRPASHVNWGWQDVVGEVLRVCDELPQPVVFILWGGHARAFTAGLQFSQHKNKAVVYSSHPSPLGAAKGNDVVPAFFGSKPFSTTNRLLELMGGEPVDWSLS